MELYRSPCPVSEPGNKKWGSKLNLHAQACYGMPYACCSSCYLMNSRSLICYIEIDNNPIAEWFNPLTASAAYIRVFIFY